MDQELESEYELCISLIYEGTVNYALTVVDGPFFSIYPYITYDNDKYTLTDVECTPLIKSSNFAKIKSFELNVNEVMIMNIKEKMESKVKKYLPQFDELFRYNTYNLSYKCKFKNENNDDDRSVKFIRNGQILSFIGGKITGIFGMASTLFELLYDSNVLEGAYNIIRSESFYDEHIKIIS